MSAAEPTTQVAAAYAGSWQAKTRRLSAPRRLVRILIFTLFGFVAGIAGAATLPALVGFQGFAVLSGSMAPTIGTGDVVVVKKIAPLDAHVGDVVTFRSPENPQKIITHRVRSIQASGETVGFTTRGDANSGTERWSVSKSGTIGKVEYRIPKLGYVTNRIGSRIGRFAFLILPALLLAALELRRIWQPEQKGPGDADPA
jgi:signal peptidase